MQPGAQVKSLQVAATRAQPDWIGSAFGETRDAALPVHKDTPH
jgi:hypothetical protein